jgi:hypothetical protein
VPIHRLRGVLQQVGRGGWGEVVGHGSVGGITRPGSGMARPWVTIAGVGAFCPETGRPWSDLLRIAGAPVGSHSVLNLEC